MPVRALLSFLLLGVGSSFADEPLPRHVPTEADLARAYSPRPERTRGRVYKTGIEPNWFSGGSRFWYRNDLPGDAREFILVDAERGTREPAFDHAVVAERLREAGVRGAQADRLPLSDLEFDGELASVRFHAGGRTWRYDRKTGELEPADVEPAEPADGSKRSDSARLDTMPRASGDSGPESELTFVNETDGEVTLYWLDSDGQRRSYGVLAAGESHAQRTFAGHAWLAVGRGGRVLAAFRSGDQRAEAVITGKPEDAPRAVAQERPDRPRSRPTGRRRSGTSSDGRWRAYVSDYDLFVSGDGSDDDPVRLTTDGEPGHGYGRFEWSSDSRTLVAFRVRSAEAREVHLVESSPDGGGRAKLHTRPYTLPGDPMTRYELHLFSLADGEWQRSTPDVEPIDFGSPRLRWLEGGTEFVYEKVDRGHQRFRMMAVDTHTGRVRTVLDERTDTFIWTSHTEQRGVPIITWLDDRDAFVYASEADGQRHLYLVDASAALDESESPSPTRIVNGGHSLEIARLVNRITEGEFVVRGIDRIDEGRGEVWFRASGGHAGQDPYYVHHYRTGLDGTGLVALTDGDGTHAIEFSPDRRFVIDTYSRADQPPIHELRSAEDGTLITRLETADASELEAAGWSPPEVFTAKGRDGETDIWGLVYRPRDFDPTKRYPVIESIYAGPHGSHVPKGFRTGNPYAALNAAGFVVVKIDGMGTANRTKAFHDVCWRNLKDAGFPDRIAWMRALGEKYPQIDLDRVGIYGGSAGGQNAAAAVLFHSDFYRAAVAGCGCHDNRMDKASWNEQWMGYPVGPWYGASSNIDNARLLGGRLLLIVGEMDTNVPPESTLRFADALIRAGKDFDLVVVPGAGHGMGGRYGQRRLMDFFVQHLQGIAPPNRNAQ